MPPKKPAAKKGRSKKKKGPDENAAFNDFLSDMFFLSKVEKQAITERRRVKILETLALLQDRGGKPVLEARELGVVVRELGLNPTQKQLAVIQSLAENPENPNAIPHAKLIPVLLDILETKELKTDELTAEGAAVTRTTLMYTEPEAAVQEAFDVLWDVLGRKVDHDRQRYLDADALRELLMNGPDVVEAFSEDDIQHFLAAAQDVGTTTINEELFMALCME